MTQILKNMFVFENDHILLVLYLQQFSMHQRLQIYVHLHCSQVGPHLGTLVPIGTKISFLVPIFFQSPHFLHFRPKNASKVSAATI